jgi:hypothetical protein
LTDKNFKKKIKILLTKNYNGRLKLKKKKLKDEYLKLTLLKYKYHNCKSNEKSKIINEVLPNIYF